MTEELKNYLEKSRASRRKLTMMAESITKFPESTSFKSDLVEKDFPEINKKRFKQFENCVQDDLKKIFFHEENQDKQKKQNQSFSYHKKRTSSFRSLVKVSDKRMPVLPKAIRFRSKNSLERFREGKSLHKHNAEPILTQYLLFSPTKIFEKYRTRSKKSLFKAILNKNSSKESYSNILHKQKTTD